MKHQLLTIGLLAALSIPAEPAHAQLGHTQQKPHPAARTKPAKGTPAKPLPAVQQAKPQKPVQKPSGSKQPAQKPPTAKPTKPIQQSTPLQKQPITIARPPTGIQIGTQPTTSLPVAESITAQIGGLSKANVQVVHIATAASGGPLHAFRARQCFFARGEFLDTLEIPMGGGGQVRVRLRADVNGAPTLIDQTVSVPSSMSTVTVQPGAAVPLQPGERYRVDIQALGSDASVSLRTTGQDVSEFGAFFAQPNINAPLSSMTCDLALKIRGRRNAPLPAEPSKRALLILVENGGFGSSLEAIDAMELELPPVPYLCYPKTGEPIIELKMEKNENIPDALVRLAGEISAFVASEAGNDPFAQGQLSATLANPLNWKVAYQDFGDVFDALSDAILEDTMKAVHMAVNSSGKYDRVVLLEDHDVKAEVVREEVLELCEEHRLDIHVLTHGTTNKIVGCESGGTTHYLGYENFFEWLYRAKAAGTQPVCIRSVYQMNCVSGSLKDEWLGLGAVAVNGTKNLESNYLPHQYVHFVDLFMNQGKSFGTATTMSYAQTVAYTKPVYDLLPREAGDEHQATVDQLLEDSRLTVVGNPNVTLF